MSETIEAAPVEEIAPAPVEAQVETPAVAAPEPVAVEPAHEPTDAEKLFELEKKVKGLERERQRLNVITRKSRDSERDRDAALARAAAAEALLAASREANGEPEPSKARPPQDAIRAEAEKLRAQERFDDRRRSLVNEGVKEFGEDDWNSKTRAVASVGATDNANFMGALVEIENAPKLIAYLADEAEELEALLAMSPTGMATKMGKMAAKLDDAPATARPSTPAPKVSTAPKPITPVSGRAAPAPDVYDPKLSMSEYVKLRDKTAPPKLGGRRQASA